MTATTDDTNESDPTAKKNHKEFRIPSDVAELIDRDRDKGEDGVLASVERRFGNRNNSETSSHHIDIINNSVGNSMRSTVSRKSSTSIQMAARAAYFHQQKLTNKKSGKPGGGGGSGGGHRRAQTLLSNIVMVGNNSERQDRISGNFGGFKNFLNINDTFRDYEYESSGDKPSNYVTDGDDFNDEKGDDDDDDIYPHEQLPLLDRLSDTSFQRKAFSARKLKARKNFVLKQKNMVTRLYRVLNPTIIIVECCRWFLNSTLIWAIPLFIVALILFYVFGNPLLPEYILSSGITFSWFLDFIGRQLLMLELAKFTQTILIDTLVITSRYASNTMGPVLTIFCIQSKGWPFITGAWGFWDLCLLQGSNKFEQHWFYFTGWKIYSEGNSGSFILNSGLYLRILLVMVFVGFIESLKRTMIAHFFSGRMVDLYKPRLEEILENVITLSEVAELSIESKDIADIIGLGQSDSDDESPHEEIKSTAEARRRGRLSVIRWSDVKFTRSSENSVAEFPPSFPENTADDDSSSNLENFDLDSQATEEYLKNEKLFMSGSTRIAIKELLDKWDEPVTKSQKSLNVSVADTIKFRQALTYMDNYYSFSEAFGPASTRNEMIFSAEAVFHRLMKLSTNSESLSFSVFDILLLQEDGTEDKIKRKRLMKLFRPRKDGSLPLLSFVQGCDNIYRNLRLFRASVSNASVIDTVLESLINPVFYSMLAIIIALMMDIKIASTLTPASGLLISFSFAFGPACAKLFEGIILIVARRPYDIGDRICITDSVGSAVPEMSMSWIVEDISIISTTLRFGASNEIATVSNSSLAYARITNCNRSEKATVHMTLYFHISCLTGERTMQMFQEGIEEYIHDNPNKWDSLFFFRCEDVDPNNEIVTYHLAVTSSNKWQISNKVLRHRGELYQYAIALSFKLHINYDAPNDRSIMYFGGSLINGGIQDYKTRVLKNSNINNNNDNNVLMGSRGTLNPDNIKQENIPISEMKMDISGTGSETVKPRIPSKNASPVRDGVLNDEDKTFLSMLQGSHT